MASLGDLSRKLRVVFGTLAFSFVVYAAHDLSTRWDASRVDVDWRMLLVGTLLAGLAMLIQLTAWRALIRSLTGKKMPGPASAKLYLDSQMARYTPGKLGLAVVRVAGADKVGVAPAIMGSALFAEVLSWLGAGTLVGGVASYLVPERAGVAAVFSAGSLLVAAGAVVVLILLTTLDRRRLPEAIRTLGKIEGSGPLVPLSVPLWHVLHFLVWTACGAAVAAAVGASPLEALMSGGLLCLAIVGGFLALLAPAGAGVREAILAAGLAPSIGAKAALAVGLLARVASLLSDVVLWGLFRLRGR